MSHPIPSIRGYEQTKQGGRECRQIFFGRGDGALLSIAVDLARFFRTLLGENALPIRGAQTHTRRAIHTVVAPE